MNAVSPDPKPTILSLLAAWQEETNRLSAKRGCSDEEMAILCDEVDACRDRICEIEATDAIDVIAKTVAATDNFTSFIAEEWADSIREEAASFLAAERAVKP